MFSYNVFIVTLCILYVFWCLWMEECSLMSMLRLWLVLLMRCCRTPVCWRERERERETYDEWTHTERVYWSWSCCIAQPLKIQHLFHLLPVYLSISYWRTSLIGLSSVISLVSSLAVYSLHRHHSSKAAY